MLNNKTKLCSHHSYKICYFILYVSSGHLHATTGLRANNALGVKCDAYGFMPVRSGTDRTVPNDSAQSRLKFPSGVRPVPAAYMHINCSDR